MNKEPLFAIAIFLFLLFFSIPSFADSFSYDMTTETTCDDYGRCIKTLYSGFSPSFYNEHIITGEDFMQFFELDYVEIDPDFGLEILEANINGISFKLNVTEEYRHTTIPLEWKFREDDYPSSMNYRLNSLSRVYNLGLNLMDLEYVKFGFNSTTIKLQDANTENLNDAYFDEDNAVSGSTTYLVADYLDGGGEITFIQFDITDIPASKLIENATLCLYTADSASASNEDLDIWRSDVHDWEEEDIDDLCGGGTVCQDVYDYFDDYILTYNGVDGVQHWDCIEGLEDAVTTDYLGGYDNVTFILNNTGDTSDYYQWRSKEYATSSLRPYLNVTYGDIPETPPTWSMNSTNYSEGETVVEHRMYWEDDGLSSYIFQFCNGTYNGTDCIEGEEGYCFQESANISTECGGLDTGSYDLTGSYYPSGAFENLIDGDYDTYAYGNAFNSFYFYINYSKPIGATNNSLWLIKSGNSTGEYEIENFTLLNDCFNQDIIQLYIRSIGALSYQHDFRCYDGDSWESLDYLDPGMWIFEEAMNWTIISPPGWVNDSSVSMTGTGNWSNVTKTINGTDGGTIAWKIYANDNYNIWNASDVFTYTVIETGGIQYNFTASLDMDWSDAESRTLDAMRSSALGMSWEDTESRILDATRSSSLTMDWSDGIGANLTEPNHYNFTVSLGLNMSDSVSRSADYGRSNSLTMNWSDGIDATKTSAGCDYDIDDCSILNMPGTYCLTDDINKIDGSHCINITTDNVILECNGHGIDTTNVSAFGINIYNITDYPNNVTIQDCNIGGWDEGISSYFATQTTIFNNTMDGNDIGIAVREYDETANCTIYNNTIINSDSYGFYSEFITNCTIYNNLFNNTNNVHMECGEGDNPCTSLGNYWNTTNQTGGRIYSDGTNIGGNYWSSPGGGTQSNITHGHEYIISDGTFLPYYDEEYVAYWGEGMNYSVWKEGGCWVGGGTVVFIGQHEGIMRQHALVKFVNNITQFDNVEFCFWVGFNQYDSGDNFTIEIYELNNQTFDNNLDISEGCDLIFDYGNMIDSAGEYNGDFVNDSICLNVTDYVASEVALGHENISFAYNSTFVEGVDKELFIPSAGYNTTNASLVHQLIYTVSESEGYSDTCTDSDCDGFCDDPLELEDSNIDYLPLSNLWQEGGCIVGDIYNFTKSLSMSWADSPGRVLDAIRSSSLTMDWSDSPGRVLDAIRLNSLTMNWSDGISYSLLEMFSRLISLDMTWTDSPGRVLDAMRSSELNMTWNDTISSDLAELLARLISLDMTWADSPGRVLDAIRSSSLTMDWSEDNVLEKIGTLIFHRLSQLTMLFGADMTPSIMSWEEIKPYEVCSILEQIADSRAYLCIYPDASYKILIRGL